VSTTQLLLLALLARLLPGGWGLLAAAVAALGGAGRPAVSGLLLLALSTLLLANRQADPPRLETPTSHPVHAVRLQGRWRVPPGRDAYLDTAAGPVAVVFAGDLVPPTPGTPVRLLARVQPDGRATAVQALTLGTPAGAWIDRWRAEASRRIRTLARAHRGLVEALLLGHRDNLSPTIRDDCIATGTMHLLALSGLHVALVAATVLRLPGLGRAATLASLGTVFVFLTLAGGRPSLLRASLGWVGITLGVAVGRLGAPLHRLAAVALLLAVVSPELAQDVGAQLSFLAVAGLLAAARLAPGGWLGPAGAFLATAPLCLELFGRVQPWGLIITPLLVPAVGLVLISGLVAVLPGAWLAGLDPVTGPLLRTAADGLARLLHACAWICPPPLTPPPFPIPGGLVSLAVVAALIVLPGHASRAGRGPHGRTAHGAA
jgi:ComEC/Rec2-related protein